MAEIRLSCVDCVRCVEPNNEPCAHSANNVDKASGAAAKLDHAFSLDIVFAPIDFRTESQRTLRYLIGIQLRLCKGPPLRAKGISIKSRFKETWNKVADGNSQRECESSPYGLGS